jgi:hypothetical protein
MAGIIDPCHLFIPRKNSLAGQAGREREYADQLANWLAIEDVINNPKCKSSGQTYSLAHFPVQNTIIADPSTTNIKLLKGVGTGHFDGGTTPPTIASSGTPTITIHLAGVYEVHAQIYLDGIVTGGTVLTLQDTSTAGFDDASQVPAGTTAWMTEFTAFGIFAGGGTETVTVINNGFGGAVAADPDFSFVEIKWLGPTGTLD